MHRVSRLVQHVQAADGPPTLLAASPTANEAPILTLLKGQIRLHGEKKAALKQALLKKGETKIQAVTVEMCINGARNMRTMVTDTSDLDPRFGISYRDRSLYEISKLLPHAEGSDVALPESVLWLLLTNDVLRRDEIKAFTHEIHRRSELPDSLWTVLDTMPKDTHPMTQISTALLVLQQGSKFASKYDEGMQKSEYWEYALEDALDIVAKLPTLAAYIYRRSFGDGSRPTYDKNLDWAANFAQMLGVNGSDEFKEMMRLFLTIHADHEGANVAAHTSHLVGSALSDPYLALSAGLCGLAGPLHGLASQESLDWLLQVQRELGGAEPTVDLMRIIAEKKLSTGQVIPGFGHAVLRRTDPRYMLQREFALKHCKDDALFKIVDCCYEAIPAVLRKSGKVRNPNPGLAAHSGQLCYHYGLREPTYYTVLFAVARSMGILSQIVWARMLGLPIERPKSVTLDSLADAVGLESSHS